ncbi:UbiA prenyltransferase family protein [Salinimicrobium xinjiangense]|uniref:hypothetical protein n=1 Tax=Salinimicrobium xinjiangense TaxID=438596 RepID=UPI0004206461|nr:hypothetical protein [Salinimicrobium xinjiangense]
MSATKKFLDVYINSSIHVAVAVVSLVTITNLHFNLTTDKSLLIFVFFGTITGYNFVKFSGVVKLYHRNLAKSLKIIRFVSLFSLLGLLITLFLVPLKVLLWSAGFGLLTLLYALPVFGRQKNLRSVSGLKIFIIAIVWAGVTVVLPITSNQNVIFETIGLEFSQRFFLVLVWILPFEIRDLKYDLQQLGTIPQRVGVTATKIIGLVILLAVVVLEILKNYSTLESILAVILTAIVTAVMVWKSNEDQSRYFTALWVEGIPVLWLMFLLLLRSL